MNFTYMLVKLMVKGLIDLHIIFYNAVSLNCNVCYYNAAVAYQYDFLSAYFLVQLIASSNGAITPAPYLLHVQHKKLVGYNAMGNQEVVWTWNSTDFFGFRLKRKIVPEIEIVIGR